MRGWEGGAYGLERTCGALVCARTPGWSLWGRRDETLSCLTSGGQSGDITGSVCVT